MKRNRFIGMTMLVSMLLAATSCTDFNDYNETPVDQQATGNQTLWENILQNDQLRNFAAILKRTGFDAELSKSRTYTVWAPLDGTYDASQYEQLSDSLLLQRMVKNHVAEYSHVATGALEERIRVLNDKTYDFVGNGTYTFGGKTVQRPNLPGNNGVMHLLNGTSDFLPSIYEYLSMGQDIDSLYKQFKRYEISVLDEKKSVKGPVIGGLQTYSDSVMNTYNSMVNNINARIANEDSSYTFLMPNNKAFRDYYNKVAPLFNYIATTVVPNVEAYENATDDKTKSFTYSEHTPAYLKDSVARAVILRNLAYSNNNEYNQWIEGTPSPLGSDTLRSTTRTKFSNPAEILGHTIQKVTASNGFVRIVDSLAFMPWEAYNPELVINPYYYAYTNDSRKNFSFYTETGRVPDSTAVKLLGPGNENFRYLWIKPIDEYSTPTVYLELPDVLSTTYKFYAVFMPWRYYEPNSKYFWAFGTDDRKCLLNFQLNYCTARGAAATYNFSSKFLTSGKASDENPSRLTKNTAFFNDPQKVDTVYLGQFTFPIAHRYLGNGNYNPTIRITNPMGVFNPSDVANYTGEVRLAAIIMKPVELVEYEEKNK